LEIMSKEIAEKIHLSKNLDGRYSDQDLFRKYLNTLPTIRVSDIELCNIDLRKHNTLYEAIATRMAVMRGRLLKPETLFVTTSIYTDLKHLNIDYNAIKGTPPNKLWSMDICVISHPSRTLWVR